MLPIHLGSSSSDPVQGPLRDRGQLRAEGAGGAAGGSLHCLPLQRPPCLAAGHPSALWLHSEVVPKQQPEPLVLLRTDGSKLAPEPGAKVSALRQTPAAQSSPAAHAVRGDAQCWDTSALGLA